MLYFLKFVGISFVYPILIMSEEIKITTSQLYKKLFVRLWRLFVRPVNEWGKIKEEDKLFNPLLADFALPLMGLTTLSTFIGFIINHQGVNLELAMKHATVMFVSLFGGLYLVFFIMGVILSMKGLKRREVMALSIYSSSLWYVVSFITVLIPELVGIYLFIIYAAYIAYTGVTHYLARASKEYQLLIAALFFILVHSAPALIKYTLLKFITL